MVGFASEVMSERSLYYLTTDMKRKIEALPSVLNTQCMAREEVLEVTLNPRA